MANQYDPIAIKSGILTVLGTDTLRADRIAAAGLTVTGLASGDVCQVSGALTLAKAVNTSTSPIVGVYDGETNSVVRKGVVVATFKSGLTLANGDVVWLSSTAGALTNVKPTADMLHEVGVVVDAANSKILLQQKPVIALPATPPEWIFVSGGGTSHTASKFLASNGSFIGKYPVTASESVTNVQYDGTNIWVGANSNPPSSTSKILAATGAVVGGPWSVGGDMTGPAAWDGTYYWVGSWGGNYYDRVDSAGSYTRYGGIRPNGIIWDGVANIWINGGATNDSTLYKINPATGGSVASAGMGWPNSVGPYGPICSDKTSIWVPVDDGNGSTWSLWKYAISNLAKTVVGSGYTGARSPAAICFDGTNIWVKTTYIAFSQVSQLIKINATTGAELGKFSLSSQAGGLTTDGTWVWVAEFSNHNFRKFLCTDGSLVGVYGDATNSPNPMHVCHTAAVMPYPLPVGM